MAEGVENVLRDGYITWRKNHNIALPFLFNLIASFLLLIIFTVLLFLLLGIPLILNFSELASNLSDSARFMNPASLLVSFLLIILLGVVLFFIYLLINSYFTAGAIGMAKTALETGKTSLDDMFSYGRKKFLSLFFANILLLIFIIVVGFVLVIIQAFIKVPFIEIFVAIVSIVFALFPFAIVISDLGAIGGLKRSYNLFMKNKLLVFLVFVFLKYVVEFISMGIFLLSMVILSAGLLSVPITMSPSVMDLAFMYSGMMILFLVWLFALIFISIIIGVFAISPLTTVWWSRFYMDLTKK